MNYQMTVIGIAIILAYSALVLIFIIWPMTGVLQNLRWKWAVLGPVTLTLLAAPWAEEYWIARNFHEACQDAGVHVYKKVAVEGFYDAMGGGIDTPGPLKYKPAIESFEKGPYRFYERLIGYDPHAKNLQVSHVEKIDGEWQVKILDKPTARYHYKRAYQPRPYKYEEPVGWKLERLEEVVVDAETGEIIARETDYKRYINVAEGSWRLYWGLAKTFCGVRSSEHLPYAALKPLSK